LRALVVLLGLLMLLNLALCFTPYPWRMYAWLSRAHEPLTEAPAWIVVLGGGGIPSESGLMRTWYAAQAGHEFPAARLVVALPDETFAVLSNVEKMRRELELRGIAPVRILAEKEGRNTREQAMKIRTLLGAKALVQPVLLVTSGPHMRRAVLTFQKAGFERVGGQVAEDTSVERDLSIEDGELEGRTLPVKMPGGGSFARYQFWNNLQYELWAAREAVALTYYWLRGWI
jgi:uncharacterized SAM-binding protein YcdF (DUF218 family)